MSALTSFLIIFFLVVGLTIRASAAATASKTPSNTQLATVFRQDIQVEQYWVSEKLDGIRARWDGHNLFSRNGHVIHAPDWFIRDLPNKTLDGELWLARQSFEKTASIVLRDTPSDDWQGIRYMLFDLPDSTEHFTQRLVELNSIVAQTQNVYLRVIPHYRMPNQQALLAKLDEVVALGAEGLMLHHQDAYYQDGRSQALLKLKKYQDAEAKVIAHLPGKGKYHYMMGALLVELDDGLQFKIGSGFSDVERQNPPPLGAYITFKYYGLTAKGVPRFASFLRIKATE